MASKHAAKQSKRFENYTEAGRAELTRKWQERVRTGNFSAGVTGAGEIRVFGRAGDAPVAYPRITSLAVLETLSEEERYAIQLADRVTAEHARMSRPLYALPRGNAFGGEMISKFDPTRDEDILVLNQIRGG